MEDVSISELRLFFERFKPQRLGILKLIDLLDDVQVGGDRVSARDPALHCIHVAQKYFERRLK